MFYATYVPFLVTHKWWRVESLILNNWQNSYLNSPSLMFFFFFIYSSCESYLFYTLEVKKKTLRQRTHLPIVNYISSDKPPLSSLLQVHLKKWDILQRGILRLITGSQAEGWRIDKTRSHKLEKWEKHSDLALCMLNVATAHSLCSASLFSSSTDFHNFPLNQYW